MILVIAGSHKEYMKFLSDIKLSEDQAKYVRTPEDLYGYHSNCGDWIIRTGKYWLNSLDKHQSTQEYEQEEK